MLRHYGKSLDVVKNLSGNNFSIETDAEGIKILKALIAEAEYNLEKAEKKEYSYVKYENGDSEEKERILIATRTGQNTFCLLLKLPE